MKYAPAVILALLPAVAHAEPGPTLNWLMNTPTTLFDRGMDEMATRARNATDYVVVKSSVRDFNFAFASADYDWETNEITIRTSAGSGGKLIKGADCKKFRAAFQKAILPFYSDKSGDAGLPGAAAKFLDLAFAHVGYQEKTRDTELGKKLAAVTFLQATVYGGDSSSAECTGRLTEADPSFKETPPPPPKIEAKP